MHEFQVATVQYHDTWISWDPVTGCLANCAYCYLGPMQLRGVRPQVLLNPAEAVARLESDRLFETSDAPIAIGNYTDFFIGQSNREYIVALLRELNQRGHRREVCLITKGTFDSDLVGQLRQTNQTDLTVFLSQSFGKASHPRIERGGTANFKSTLENARLVSAIEGWSAVHYWRPFLSAWNPLDSLRERVLLLKDSGALSSVVVGHKRFHDIRRTSPEMLMVTRPDHDVAVAGNSEDFFEVGFKRLTEIADELGYRIFRNTSCSLAAAHRRPDSLATYSSELTSSHCLAVSCSASQRAICASPTVQFSSSDLDRIASITEIDRDSITIGIKGNIEVIDQISEPSYNALRYMVKSPIQHAGISATSKVWFGAEIGHASSRTAQDLLAEGPEHLFPTEPIVLRRVERLKYITGFATAFSVDDPRFSVFSRFDHVQRVAWVAQKLGEITGASIDEALKYVWLHDLNRWAFAHNAELGNYVQAEDAPRYFGSLAGGVSHYGEEMRDFHGKVLPGPNIAYDTALAADMLSGMLEDPLMLLGGLNVDSAFLAGSEGFATDYYLAPERMEALQALAHTLHVEQNPQRFRLLFSEQFSRAVNEFLELELTSRGGLANIVLRITHETKRFKEVVLRPKVFPVNNELVSRSSSIKVIVREITERLGEDAVRDLMLEIDDRSAIEFFRDLGVDSEKIHAVKPQLSKVAALFGTTPLIEVD